MLRICFVKQGDAYSAEYVNILADCISRNLEAGFEGTFECFTDDPSGILPYINIHALPSDLKGWWSKLWLFKNGHFADGDRIVYFDLDTIIMGRLDEIVKYDGPFATLCDFFKPHNDVQSAVLAWPANTQEAIWREWDMLGRPEPKGGDQEIIQMSLDERGIIPDFWQDLFPGLFVSYKSGSFKRVPPKGCSVLCFHGQPKPHNCNSTWVEGVWKIDGTQAFEIEQFCNTEERQIEENIRHAISLDYPWLAPVDAHNRTAIIVGGAPSLKQTYPEILDIKGDIFATNGTAKFLSDHSIKHDYHVIVDARPHSAEFLKGQKPSLGYLLASQCDSSVFDAVQNSHVIVWHPKIKGIVELVENDERPKCIVGGGSTVCLKAMAMAYVLGYRKFQLFGMDSSFSGDDHHAYPQTQNDDDLKVLVQVDNKSFHTTPWMVAQADEFQDLVNELLRLGCEFHIHGDGLIPYILREMVENTPARQRGNAILDMLPARGTLFGAEIGVFAGELSAILLMNERIHLAMVDAWDSAVYESGADDFHATLSEDDQHRYMLKALENTEFAKDRRTVMVMSSAKAANLTDDASLDFVFIDADHTYEACMADLKAWYPKLKDGGLLSGHDYNHPEFPNWGVKRAVDEFAAAYGLEIALGDNFTWFSRKPLAKAIAA